MAAKGIFAVTSVYLGKQENYKFTSTLPLNALLFHENLICSFIS